MKIRSQVKSIDPFPLVSIPVVSFGLCHQCIQTLTDCLQEFLGVDLLLVLQLGDQIQVASHHAVLNGLNGRLLQLVCKGSQLRQLAEVAKILGVSEDSISAMNDEIKNSMTAVFETVAIRNDEDKKIVFEALDDLWQKGSVYIGLDEVAKSTGILLVTLRSLDYDTQQTIVYEYMMDSSQTERFYDLVNKALAVSDLGNVAKLIGVPVRELRPLPRRIQENICGAYAMEYDADSTNTDLIDTIREMIAP